MNLDEVVKSLSHYYLMDIPPIVDKITLEFAIRYLMKLKEIKPDCEVYE